MQKVLSEQVQCPSNYQDLADGIPITIFKGGTPITIFKGLLSRSHLPNVDENIADQPASIKIKAEEHPEQLPAQLLWTEVQGVPDEVLSQLPSQPVLVRAMQRNY